MMDREKVTKGLECCSVLEGKCEECPYETEVCYVAECTSALAKDALELLKEQEPVPLIHSAEYEEYWDIENICPKCNARWISLAEDHFCPQCGQAVK